MRRGEMTGKVYLVTGANAGIGRATALGLAQLGAKVVMVARNRERGEAAQVDIQKESDNEQVDLLLADLSVQADIRQLAKDFKERYTRLDVLINNAGIIPPARSVTVDGLETQFAVNHLAYFLLTNLLLDVLKASAPARVVNVSSGVHHSATIDFDDLQSTRSYSARGAYNRTKLMNVLFTYELASRLEGTGVTANCLHPGAVATNMLADYRGIPRGEPAGGVSLAEGARTSIYLATSAEVEGVGGKYFDNMRAVRSSELSYDSELAKRLWQVSAELTGLI